jgi:hypothetical protein
MLAPARMHRTETFAENMESLRGTFDAKDYERTVVADAVLQFVLDSGRPVTPAEVKHFLKEHEFAELFSPEVIAVAAIVAIARSTCGLALKGGAVTVDPAGVEIAVGATEARLSAFRAMDNVRAHPDSDPPRAVGDVVARVKELVRDCCDADRFPGIRGAAPVMSPDARACELAIIERVLGRSPQLEAFLASLVAGDDVPLSTVAKSVAKLTDARLPKKPETLLADAIEFDSVEVKDGGVRVEQTFASVIASTRTLLASLRKHLPKPIAAPRMKRVTVPAMREVDVVAVPEPVDAPEPESAREEQVVDPIDEVVAAPEPPEAQDDDQPADAAFDGLLPDDDAVADREHAEEIIVVPAPRKKRRGPKAPFNPQPVSAHRLTKDVYGDEAETPLKKTVVTTIDGRQSSDFDPVKDNPKMFDMLVSHFMNNEGMESKDAEVAAETRMRKCMPAATGKAAEPQVPATPDPRHEWPVMPPPPMIAPTIWNSGALAVHPREMPVPVPDAKTVFEAVLEARSHGGVPDFEPLENDGFEPTLAVPGSEEKLDVLVGRIQVGNPLWHPDDRVDFSNVKFRELSAAVRAELTEKEAEIAKREKMDAIEAEKKRKKAEGIAEPKTNGRPRKQKSREKQLAIEAAAS